MIRKAPQLIVCLVGLVLLIVSYVLLVLLEWYEFELSLPLCIYSVAILAVGVMLMVADKRIVLPWSKFAVPWTVISAALVYFSPTNGSALFRIDKNTVSMALGVLFVVVSLAIIIKRSFFFRQGGGHSV
jgi:hypothetical protein